MADIIYAAGLGQKALQFANNEFVRAPIFGGTWSRIRIGIIFGWPSVGYNTPYTFQCIVGMCSGKSNPYNAGTTTNFIGFNPVGTAASVTCYGRYGPPYWMQGFGQAVIKRVGTTTTVGPIVSATFNYGVTSQNTTGTGIIDITKGSPNYTFSTYYGYNQSSATMYANVMTESPPSGYNTGVNAQTFAVDESTGAFDNFEIFYSLVSNPFQVWDVAIGRLKV